MVLAKDFGPRGQEGTSTGCCNSGAGRRVINKVAPGCLKLLYYLMPSICTYLMATEETDSDSDREEEISNFLWNS